MTANTGRTFWSRVQEALRTAGKPDTQTHLATVLKIEQPSISDWNKPGGFPIVERVIEIARYADVCVEWLYTERGPKHPPPVDPTAQQLWEIWPRLDDVSKGEILGRAIERAGPPRIDGAVEPKRA